MSTKENPSLGLNIIHGGNDEIIIPPKDIVLTGRALQEKIIKERSERTHKACNEKANKLVLDYLREAKDDKLGAPMIFKKYDLQWKKIAHEMNRMQKDIVVNTNTFELRVNIMMKHANKQIEQERIEAEEQSKEK